MVQIGNDIKVFFNKVHEDAIIPAYAKFGDAGCDVRVIEGGTIAPQQVKKLRTGFRIALPAGIQCEIRPRSGWATKHCITLPNSPATIDPGYRGEIIIPLINLGEKAVRINKLDAVAQMVFTPFFTGHFIETVDLDKTERGSGGFGHSGLR